MATIHYYAYLPSPVGQFFLAGTDQALTYTGFATGYQQRAPEVDWKHDAKALDYAIPQLAAYFAGEVINFDIPMLPIGTPFQQQVWTALQTIPHGATRSYGQIATQLGSPGSSRAVGSANRANHLPIVIPCHRVIGADGSLTGFGGGLDTKATLLELEGHTDDNREQLSLWS